jgi:hypothetical protein
LKEYIRGHPPARPDSQSPDVIELAGSEGFVQNSIAMAETEKRFEDMMSKASKVLNLPGGVKSTRATSVPQLELPGPEYFCIMQQFGSFSTERHENMDLFLRDPNPRRPQEIRPLPSKHRLARRRRRLRRPFLHTIRSPSWLPSPRQLFRIYLVMRRPRSFYYCADFLPSRFSQ